VLDQQRRVQLEDQGNLEVPRQLATGRAEQAMTLVNQIRAELLEYQASLELEAGGIQQIAEVLRQPGARTDRFALQRVVQLAQRAGEWDLSLGAGSVRVRADVGRENQHVVTFGPKRLHETAHVRRRALGSKDRDAEVGCQIVDAHAANCPGST